MALPSSGPISMSMVRKELEIDNFNNVSFNGLEFCRYTNLNCISISSSLTIPNIQSPHTMSEWYNYNHKDYDQLTGDYLYYNGFIAPYGYPYTTFATVDLGQSSMYNVGFTASNIVNSGLAPNAAVSYSLYYASHSLSIPDSKLIKRGVLTSANNSDSFFYDYNSTSGSYVTWIWNGAVQEAVLDFDANYIIISYEFNTGLDLDTRTRIIDPNVGQDDNVTPIEYLGYSDVSQEPGNPGRVRWPPSSPIPGNLTPITASNRPYLIWGKDNTGIGRENIYVDLTRFYELTTSQSISIDCRAWWYVTRGTTPVNLLVSFYTGSFFIRNTGSYNFEYQGTNQPTTLGSTARTINLESPSPQIRGERIAVITYNLSTRQVTLDSATTIAPGQGA